MVEGSRFQSQNASTASNSPIIKREDGLRVPVEMFDDDMLGDEFKNNVAIPYFKRIFKDLVLQSD